MIHKVVPYPEQELPVFDRNDPTAVVTAIELNFPSTFSKKAWRVIDYYAGVMYLFAYKGKFIVTDDMYALTPNDGEADGFPECGPLWTGSSLDELERWLEQMADASDASTHEIPEWEEEAAICDDDEDESDEDKPRHQVVAYVEQSNPALDRNDPEAAVTAIEIRFPDTFSYKAWRVIKYFRGCMFLYAYKSQFVVTDESLMLTPSGDGTSEAPIGGPRWVGNSLDKLESWLEKVADENDASDEEIPGWEYPQSFHPRLSVGDFFGPAKNVMVTLVHDYKHVSITTYERRLGRRGEFVIWSDSLEQMLSPSATKRTERDGGTNLAITRRDDSLRFLFSWGNYWSDYHEQEVVIPIRVIQTLLERSQSIKYLYCPDDRPVEIDSRQAAAEIHEIAQDKLLRRAFTNAIRDKFYRSGEKAILYPIEDHSFLFLVRGPHPRSGSLILVEGEYRGKPWFQYSLR